MLCPGQSHVVDRDFAMVVTFEGLMAFFGQDDHCHGLVFGRTGGVIPHYLGGLPVDTWNSLPSQEATGRPLEQVRPPNSQLISSNRGGWPGKVSGAR